MRLRLYRRELAADFAIRELGGMYVHIIFPSRHITHPHVQRRRAGGNAEVTLIFQGDSVYNSLQGTAHSLTDPEPIDRLWSEAWRVWFPDGKDDPSPVILKIEPQDAEYWDNSGGEGISYAMTALKAYIAGERHSNTDAAQHAKMAM